MGLMRPTAHAPKAAGNSLARVGVPQQRRFVEVVSVVGAATDVVHGEEKIIEILLRVRSAFECRRVVLFVLDSLNWVHGGNGPRTLTDTTGLKES